MTSQLWWYLARSGGLVAWALLSASVLWGLALSTRILGPRPRPNWILDLHRFLGGLAVVFTGLHVVGLVLDSYVDFGLTELLVPMASSYRPGPVAWGVAALYLLVAVEITDVIFAVDSVPAILAVSNEPFLVFSANAFAILGLRAMYFVIVGMLTRFRYLNVGLAVVLGLVGVKMLLSDVYHPPIYITLGAVVVVLSTAVLASLWATRGEGGSEEIEPGPAVRVGKDPV